jgi:hypothetical protein
MANLLESSQTAATTAPGYYNDYLSNLANSGKAAATNAQYVGAQPLQEKAFQQVENLPSAYQPTLTAAGQTLNQATTNPSPLSAGAGYLSEAALSPAQRAKEYMNPYLESVVGAIGDVGQRNIQQNLAPGATAAAVGSGQFGSQRGAQVLGQTLTNANRDILNQQYQALNSGYGQALTAAGQQGTLLGQLGSTAGQQAYQGQSALTAAGQAQAELAAKQQGLSLGDINALSTLGGQQQTIAQNKELFPLQNLTTASGLLRGYNVPTSTKTTAQASPLSTIGAIATGTAGFFSPQFDSKGKPISGSVPYDSLIGGLKNTYKSIVGERATGLNPITGEPTGTGFGSDYFPGDFTTDSLGNVYKVNADGTTSLYHAVGADDTITPSVTDSSENVTDSGGGNDDYIG